MQNLDLENAADEAGCTLRLNLPNEGSSHLEPDAKPPNYRTNPPTSGDHVTTPYQQADGAYAEMPQPIEFVHSLEHGRIEIQYAPDLPEADQLALKGIFDESPSGMLLFPNPDMPYEVAATAWTHLMGCKGYEGTQDAGRDSQLPQPVPGPRPRGSPVHPVGEPHSPRRFSSSLLNRRSRSVVATTDQSTINTGNP